MKETVKTIMEWHEKTFPNATLCGQLLKYKEEREEYEESKSMLELADMFIVACGVGRFDSLAAAECFSFIPDLLACDGGVGAYAEFQECINSKMEKNRKRVWVETTDGAYHHQNGIED